MSLSGYWKRTKQQIIWNVLKIGRVQATKWRLNDLLQFVYLMKLYYFHIHEIFGQSINGLDIYQSLSVRIPFGMNFSFLYLGWIYIFLLVCLAFPQRKFNECLKNSFYKYFFLFYQQNSWSVLYLFFWKDLIFCFLVYPTDKICYKLTLFSSSVPK